MTPQNSVGLVAGFARRKHAAAAADQHPGSRERPSSRGFQAPGLLDQTRGDTTPRSTFFRSMAGSHAATSLSPALRIPSGARTAVPSCSRAASTSARNDEDNRKIAAERKERKYNLRIFDSFPIRYWITGWTTSGRMSSFRACRRALAREISWRHQTGRSARLRREFSLSGSVWAPAGARRRQHRLHRHYRSESFHKRTGVHGAVPGPGGGGEPVRSLRTG